MEWEDIQLRNTLEESLSEDSWTPVDQKGSESGEEGASFLSLSSMKKSVLSTFKSSDARERSTSLPVGGNETEQSDSERSDTNKPGHTRSLSLEVTQSKKRRSQKGSPLTSSSRSETSSAASALDNVSKDELDALARRNQTRYLGCVERNDIATIEVLLEKGVDPNALNENGHTALTLSIRDCKLGIFMMLILSPLIDFTTRDLTLSTPLLVAAKIPVPDPITRSNSFIFHKLLLEQPSIDVDAKDISGMTALSLAVKRDHVEVVSLLLKAGANPSITNKEGDTALHFAASLKKVEICLLLLENGAPLSVRNRQKQLPADLLPASAPEQFHFMMKGYRTSLQYPFAISLHYVTPLLNSLTSSPSPSPSTPSSTSLSLYPPTSHSPPLLPPPAPPTNASSQLTPNASSSFASPPHTPSLPVAAVSPSRSLSSLLCGKAQTSSRLGVCELPGYQSNSKLVERDLVADFEALHSAGVNILLIVTPVNDFPRLAELGAKWRIECILSPLSGHSFFSKLGSDWVRTSDLVVDWLLASKTIAFCSLEDSRRSERFYWTCLLRLGVDRERIGSFLIDSRPCVWEASIKPTPYSFIPPEMSVLTRFEFLLNRREEKELSVKEESQRALRLSGKKVQGSDPPRSPESGGGGRGGKRDRKAVFDATVVV